MHRRCALGLHAIGLLTIPAFPTSSDAQAKSLRDQLVGTWVYVSSTAKRDDGSDVPRPSLQGAVTYTNEGRFHFITTRTDLPKYVSNDSARPSPEEAMAVASGSIAYTGTIHGGRKHKNDPRKYPGEYVSEPRRSAQSAADRFIHWRRRNEVHESSYGCWINTG